MNSVYSVYCNTIYCIISECLLDFTDSLICNFGFFMHYTVDFGAEIPPQNDIQKQKLYEVSLQQYLFTVLYVKR